MKLSIVIPALNEEEAIANTIFQCQDTVNKIIKQTAISEIEIIVVSDGSTDRTLEIAKRFEGIKLIAFEEAVNTTLGLPFIRTSPDHGTGFDIAGLGCARSQSMLAAIKTAWELTKV